MRAVFRVLAVVLGWVLLVVTGPSSPAVAAPSETESVTPQVGGRRNSLGELTAPDEVSARTVARLTGERVEVVGSRSEFSTTWALPDGSLSSGHAAGPVWVRVGGSGQELEDWLEVDLDLVRSSDGWVRPKGHPGEVRFSGGSESPVEVIASVADRTNAEDSLSLRWGDVLPTPVLTGPRATYLDVLPGVDLVLEATRTGFEQFFIIRERPEPGSAPDLGVTLQAAGRFGLRGDTEGGASVVAGKEEIAKVGTPQVWDARLDAEREHPVTEAWSWGTPGLSGLARSIGTQPEWSAEPAPGVERPLMGPEGRPEVGRERKAARLPVVENKIEPAEKPGRLPDGVDAVDIKSGDSTIDPFGDRLIVTKVVTRTEYIPAYNLTVNHLHTYYVGVGAVLVHNAACKLPPSVIVNQKGVKITHNYRSNDHAPVHLHVIGGGRGAKIGMNGKLLRGQAELTKKQQAVVRGNIRKVRKSVKSIVRWYVQSGRR